jgi:hypothetical protein
MPTSTTTRRDPRQGSQEMLTNMARHTTARDADVLLRATEDRLLGTREHALRLGGGVTIQARSGQGTTAMLEVPREQGRRASPRSPVTGRS